MEVKIKKCMVRETGSQTDLPVRYLFSCAVLSLVWTDLVDSCWLFYSDQACSGDEGPGLGGLDA